MNSTKEWLIRESELSFSTSEGGDQQIGKEKLRGNEVDRGSILSDLDCGNVPSTLFFDLSFHSCLGPLPRKLLLAKAEASFSKFLLMWENRHGHRNTRSDPGNSNV